jgi:hypothetical protein
LITIKEAYVGYVSPSFRELAETFKETENVVLSDQLFNIHGDGNFTMSFADKALRQKWVDYHRKNASLEIRSKRVLGTKI